MAQGNDENDENAQTNPEPADKVGTRTDVGGSDSDCGIVAARILPGIQRTDRLKPGDQNHQVHHEGEHRPADEQISERFHALDLETINYPLGSVF